MRYTPISIEAAKHALLAEAVLWRVEIASLRSLLEALLADPDYNGQPLRLSSCRIVECNCDRMKIKCPVDFEYNPKSLVPTTFLNSASFLDAVFESVVDFSQTSFQDGGTFSRAVFEGEVSYRSCEFLPGGDASFHDCVFKSNADFGLSHFHSTLEFQKSVFRGSALFVGLVCDLVARFPLTQFEGKVDFTNSHFTAVDMVGAMFRKEAEFSQVRLVGARFDRASFENGVTFYQARVASQLIPDHSTVAGTLNLEELRLLPRDLARISLYNLRMRRDFEIRVTVRDIGRGRYRAAIAWLRCLRGLRSMRSGWKYKIDRAPMTLLLRLCFTASRWAREQMPWCHFIEGEDSEDPNECKNAGNQYKALRDSLRRLPGAEDVEDLCHYKYMDLKRRGTTGRWVWKALDLVYKHALGYGVFVSRILTTIALVIALFALVYHCAYIADPTLIFNSNCKSFDPIYFSVVTFTTIGYGDFAPVGWLRYVAGTEGMLGLILTAVFTVSFARKFIR